MQSVLNQLARDSRHVTWFPCEGVLIFPEEANEHAFLFGVQAVPDVSHLRGIGQVQLDFLG
jgi:hypothetical protein